MTRLENKKSRMCGFFLKICFEFDRAFTRPYLKFNLKNQTNTVEQTPIIMRYYLVCPSAGAA